MAVHAYLRTSTADQVNGIEAQRSLILARYPQAVEHVEHATGKSLDARPVFTELISSLQPGDTLVVSKLDRFARSVIDAVTIASDLSARQVGFVSLDLNVDLTSPMGKLAFTMLSAVAEFERDLIAERTRNGLAVVRAKGTRLGRPTVDDVTCEAIMRMSEAGCSIRSIAAALAVSKSAVQRCIARNEDA